MKCCIEIDLRSEDFFDYGGGQLADMFRDLSDMLRDFIEHLDNVGLNLDDLNLDELDCLIRDRNGKTCGHATVEIDVDERALAEMVSVLDWRGDKFTGDHIGDTARGWIDCGFKAEDADEWCKIGCWEPTVAAQLRDAGKTPAQVAAAVNSLVEDAGVYCRDKYTAGDPMYSACNRDTSLRVLIEACE